MILEVTEGLDLNDITIKFTYSASDPLGITFTDQPYYNTTGASAWTTRDGRIYTLPEGVLRIWAKDASDLRNPASIASSSGPGDFVPSGVDIPFTALNGDTDDRTVTLYVEGVKSSISTFPGTETIAASMTYPYGTSTRTLGDQVRVTVSEVVIGGASGDVLATDDYSFNKEDDLPGLSGSASVVIYSMPVGGNMTLKTMTLPIAPQIMNEVIEYEAVRELTPESIAPLDVSPTVSQSYRQNLTASSTGGKGFTFLDATPVESSGNEVKAGNAVVVVLEKRDVRIGVRRVNQRSADGSNDFDAPAFTASDAQELKNYLNDDVYYQANVSFEVVLLGDLNIDYDYSVIDQKLTAVPTAPGLMNEQRLIASQGNDSNYEYMLYIVNGIVGLARTDENGNPVWADWEGFADAVEYPNPTARHIYMTVAADPVRFKNTAAHEIGHAMGLPHPFEYTDGDGMPTFLLTDYDPENLMNYTDGVALRFFQWVRINPFVTSQEGE